MKNDLVRFPLTLVIIALVGGVGVGKVFNATKVKQDQYWQAVVSEHLHLMFPQANAFECLKYSLPVDSFWVAKNPSGSLAGFGYLGKADGVGGTITCLAGIDTLGSICGLAVINSDEIPGIQQRPYEENVRLFPFLPQKRVKKGTAAFLEQFKGLDSKKEIKIIRQEPRPAGSAICPDTLARDNAVCAYTGATLSSRAITSAVNARGNAIIKRYRAMQAPALADTSRYQDAVSDSKIETEMRRKKP